MESVSNETLDVQQSDTKKFKTVEHLNEEQGHKEEEKTEEDEEEEEEVKSVFLLPEPIPVCKCMRDDESSEKVEISARKQMILTTVARTESYLHDRRIPELIRFLLTKVISIGSEKPVAYLVKLLDECMLFRAGHGNAPVLFEDRHLEAVVKSFDPGQRGWLSEGQVRRAYATLGLTPKEPLGEKVSCDVVLSNLKETQEIELQNLLSAGTQVGEPADDSKTESFV